LADPPERADVMLIAECQADLVDALEQAVLAE
jgi:hypothetical protein